MCEDGRKIGLWITEKSQTSIPMIAVNIQNIKRQYFYVFSIWIVLLSVEKLASACGNSEGNVKYKQWSAVYYKQIRVKSCFYNVLAIEFAGVA